MITLNYQTKMKDFVLEHNNLNGFIEFYGKKIKYSKFFEYVDNLSQNLLAYGINKGDTVTIMLPNCPSFAMLIYALSNIGAISSLISPLLSEQQATSIINKTNSKHLILSTLCSYEFSGINKIRVDFGYFMGMPAKLLFLKKKGKDGYPFENLLKRPKALREIPEVNPTHTAFYLHSGGTTGVPKTVMLSQQAVNYAAVAVVDNLSENDISLHSGANSIYVLPMFYGYGLDVLHTSFTMSFNLHIRVKFKPVDLAKDIAKNKIEIMYGVPVMYNKMLATGLLNEENCPAFKVCYSGGEALSEKLEKAFYEALPNSIILNGYGLTEAVSAFISCTKLNSKKGSCGKVSGLIKMDAFDGETKLARGELGEVCVCTQAIMNGYYNDSENTNKTLFTYEGETWLRTGDFGKVDEDGFLFLSSRIKNIIKRKGINIFPSQVESTISKLDYVKDVVIFGYKDKEEIERIVCALIPKENAPENLEDEVKQFVKSQLSVLCCPEYFLIKDKFELTTVGKVNTLVLKDEVKNKFGI